MILVAMVVLALLSWFLPVWWWIVVVPLAYGLWRSRSGPRAFLAGFLTAGVVWGGAAVWLFANGAARVTERVAVLLQVPEAWMLLAILTVVAGVVGGFAASGGFYLREAFPWGRSAKGTD